MKIIEKIKITKKLKDDISQYFTQKFFQTKSPLFYQGQIPLSGFFILKGSVEIYKSKKNKKVFESGTLFALNECINKIPTLYNAEVLPESEIFILDQSTIKELLEDDKSTTLKEDIKKLLNINNEIIK